MYLQEAIGEEAVVDMGSMGWRLGVPMCKIMEDRHGPKGQWVRKGNKEVWGKIIPYHPPALAFFDAAVYQLS